MLLCAIRAGDDRRLYYHFDEAGNTILITDDAGEIVAAYAYAPFGEVLAETGEVENRFTYAGAFGVEREGDTSLYYSRARYYDSRAARFVSRDPVRSLEPRAVNPYQYGGGSPLSFVDPDGRTGRSVRDLTRHVTALDERDLFFVPHEVANFVRLATLDLALGGPLETGSRREARRKPISQSVWDIAFGDLTEGSLPTLADTLTLPWPEPLEGPAPLNFGGGAGTITQEMLDYIQHTGFSNGFAEVTASVFGERVGGGAPVVPLTRIRWASGPVCEQPGVSFFSQSSRIDVFSSFDSERHDPFLLELESDVFDFFNSHTFLRHSRDEVPSHLFLNPNEVLGPRLFRFSGRVAF